MKYSRNRVKKAGKELAENKNVSESMDILSFWRAKHASPLERAYKLIEKEVSNISSSSDKRFAPVIAKRLKRTNSILKKLTRTDLNTDLHTMNDIGGCRVILSSRKKVDKLCKVLEKKDIFKIRRDYITTPKKSGYRSIHLIGKFNAGDRDLPIELQVRTKTQHAWATALEIVDIFTRQSIKTNSGEKDWVDFFSHVSKLFEILEKNPLLLGESLENIAAQFALDMNNSDLEYSFFKTYEYIKNLNIINRFEAFSSSLNVTANHIEDKKIEGYVLIKITIMPKNISLEEAFFPIDKIEEATDKFIELEKETLSENDIIVALVSTNAIGGIEEAYPNYFADAEVFLSYLKIITFVYKHVNPGYIRLFNRFRFNIGR
ncbi:MAG: (p)ppGpp synthetase [Arcobacter sp.]|nr:MAG: (p)ppGpp synthetase [Arcobacter sp.]